MTLLRCSQKLLKRLRQPAKLAEPPPSSNPLGEWCADIDFIDREPFAVVMNAATGMSLVLPARAADLKQLHVAALRSLEPPFSRKDLPAGRRRGYHYTADLLHAHLRPPAKILPFAIPTTRQ